jgi:hypothetical protein
VTVPAIPDSVIPGQMPEVVRADVIEAAVGCLEVLHNRRKGEAITRMVE